MKSIFKKEKKKKLLIIKTAQFTHIYKHTRATN